MHVNVLCGARVAAKYVIYITKLNAQGAICRKIRPLVRKKGQASLCRRAAAQVGVEYDQRGMNIFVDKKKKNLYIVFKSATRRKSNYVIEKIHSQLTRDNRFNKWKDKGVDEKNDLQSFVLRSPNVFAIRSNVRESVKKKPRSSKKKVLSIKNKILPKLTSVLGSLKRPNQRKVSTRKSVTSIIGTKPLNNHDPIVVGDSEEKKEEEAVYVDNNSHKTRGSPRREGIIVVDDVDERTLEEISVIFKEYKDNADESGKSKETIFKLFNIEISRHQFCTLMDGIWLSDNVIDAYVGYLRETNANANSEGTLYVQSQTITSLISHYKSITPERLMRRNKKILGGVRPENVKKIYIVLHLGTHWVLVVVDVVARHLLIYDSLSGSNKLTKEQQFSSYVYSRAALQIITNNFKTFGPDASKKKEWHVGINVENLTTPDSIPQQQNGTDCGVFMLMNMDRLSHNRKLDYTQTDIRVYRNKIAAAIIKNAETNS